jgi:hypothetical protein
MVGNGTGFSVANGKSFPTILNHFSVANEKYLHRDFTASEARVNYGRPRTDGAIFEKAGYKVIHLYTSGTVKTVYYHHPLDTTDALTPEIMEDAAKLLYLGVLDLANDKFKTGLMIRSSAASNSPVVACTVHGDGLTSLQYRTKPGENMREVKFTISAPDVLQLEKKGNCFTMSVAHFGELYQVQKVDSIDLGSDLMAGLFVCSHNNKFSEEVEFTNTLAFNPAPSELFPYKNYLGSLLEVMDVATGHRETVASSTTSLQAPNWTPDAKTLIYNSGGQLYNFDLATRTSSVLNTGFADKNNNDHVLTFDGKQIGISHQPEETKGQSVVYTVPVTGGVPKKITEKSPSYFHGWSPDNQFLLYTGERNGDYDIYKTSKDGGKEVQLRMPRVWMMVRNTRPMGNTSIFVRPGQAECRCGAWNLMVKTKPNLHLMI